MVYWLKLEAEVEKQVQLNGSVGTSVIVVNRDTTLFSMSSGYINLKDSSKITDSTFFALGSITKTFTGLGILRLVETGELNLEDEVAKLAPEILIGNNVGKINGWIPKSAVLGKVI